MSSCAFQLSGLESAEKLREKEASPEKQGEVILEVDMKQGRIKEKTEGIDLGNVFLNMIMR